MSVRLMLAILVPYCFHLIEPVSNRATGDLPPQNNTLFEHVADIPLPKGYVRLYESPDSFGSWLRAIKLKADNKVYLFDGSLKPNQSAQHVVLDIPVGKKDLQQCADAVMRLRAEYLLEKDRVAEICFSDNSGKKYTCPTGPTRLQFERYLEKVYNYCGTTSLEKQLNRVRSLDLVQIGDVIIRGGSPGHAVIVIDVAQNSAGRKIFLIAQSYMPAQSIHVLRNPAVPKLSPWYQADSNLSVIRTPEWDFKSPQLMRW